MKSKQGYVSVARGVCALLSLVACLGSQANDDTVSTVDILEEALDFACMSHEIIGGCLWLSCDIDGCDIKSSIKVKHNLPELVVTSYPYLGQSPWPDTEDLALTTEWAEDGGGTDGGGAYQRQALKFKNVEVLGSPSTSVYHANGTVGVLPLCQPLTDVLTPHFISTLDPQWRDPLLETAKTVENALEWVGKGGSHFASLYPRLGFVQQSHDYKASLVAAIRAADIVRNDGTPHVYTALSGNGREGQWPPGSGTDFEWQQLVPSVMGCKRLPDIDDSTDLTDPYSARLNPANGNAWQLWRPYECCQKRGDDLIEHF